MRISCWIPKATHTHTHTHTHSEYVIFIAFTLQQWLQERASLLRYTYIARLIITEIVFTARYEMSVSKTDYVSPFKVNFT